jgi:hypothetical protein
MAKGGDGTRKGADRTSAAERRLQRKKHRSNRASAAAVGSTTNGLVDTDNDTHIVDLLSKNEDELLNFVAMVNRVYQEKLHKPAPFMTFVLLGIQSAGKSGRGVHSTLRAFTMRRVRKQSVNFTEKNYPSRTAAKI